MASIIPLALVIGFVYIVAGQFNSPRPVGRPPLKPSPSQGAMQGAIQGATMASRNARIGRQPWQDMLMYSMGDFKDIMAMNAAFGPQARRNPTMRTWGIMELADVSLPQAMVLGNRFGGGPRGGPGIFGNPVMDAAILLT